MRIGTPGFIGGRLTEAREARGLTQTALAEMTGLKSQSVSHYEQGRQSPSPEALEVLCESLRLPQRFFLRPVQDPPGTHVFFRPLLSSAKHARSKAERRLGWLQELSVYVRRHVALGDAVLPDLPVDPSRDEAGTAVERVAGEVRAALGLGSGPLGSVVSILEASGCAVSRCATGVELGGSCSRRDAGTGCVMLGTEEMPASRARVHAAQELGHLVMHRAGGGGAFAHAQAARFARAFLLPAREFRQDVWAPTIDALLTSKKEWRCPVGEMVARCGEIGLMDEAQVRRSMVNLTRRGWKTKEPREEFVPAEKPLLLASALRLLVDEGLKTPHEMLADLALGAADIEELAGLPRGHFSGQDAMPAAALRLRRPDAAERPGAV